MTTKNDLPVLSQEQREALRDALNKRMQGKWMVAANAYGLGVYVSVDDIHATWIAQPLKGPDGIPCSGENMFPHEQYEAHAELLGSAVINAQFALAAADLRRERDELQQKFDDFASMTEHIDRVVRMRMAELQAEHDTLASQVGALRAVLVEIDQPDIAHWHGPTMLKIRAAIADTAAASQARDAALIAQAVEPLKFVYSQHQDGRECFCPYCVAFRLARLAPPKESSTLPDAKNRNTST
jgi:hypothetical protein